MARLLDVGKKRGFPGMLGSLDCMHWTWKNCPTAYGGQYIGKEKEPTVILEAVALYNTWIWHAFFGLPGTLNNINVLDQSPLFQAHSRWCCSSGQLSNQFKQVHNALLPLGFDLSQVGNSYPDNQLSNQQEGKELCQSSRSMPERCQASFWDLTGSMGYYQAAKLIMGTQGTFFYHENMHHHAQHDCRG